MHTSAHSSALGRYADPMFNGEPLPSCDEFLRKYLKEFKYNQIQSYHDKKRADNDTWDTFNSASDHIVSVDIRAVPSDYRHYIAKVHGHTALMKLESRCQRRSNAELREIDALAKPSQAQNDWFRQRLDSGEKSGPELYGELNEKNWLRRFITNEPTYLWQFPETYRKTPTVRFNDDWYMRTSRNMYIEEMTVFAQWLCMNNSCKFNLGQQVSFPYTDWNKVRSCRHVSYTRDNKPNRRRLQGVPARYHELIQDLGFKVPAPCPQFIKPLFRDEIINGRVSSIAV